VIVVIVAAVIVAVAGGVVRVVTVRAETVGFRVGVTSLLVGTTCPVAVRILESLEWARTVVRRISATVGTVRVDSAKAVSERVVVARSGGVVVRRVVATIWSDTRTSCLAVATVVRTVAPVVLTVKGKPGATRNPAVAVMI